MRCSRRDWSPSPVSAVSGRAASPSRSRSTSRRGSPTARGCASSRRRRTPRSSGRSWPPRWACSPRPATTLADSVIDALHLRELVLVLDNCEHLVEAVGHLADGLLRDCPGVRILATSREALGVAGEQVWPLSALELPARSASVDTVMESDAVQLFAERARAVQPGFVLDASNAETIAEICRRLDGIPLAVELAAARVTIMTPIDIAARLDQRFQLLTGGRRGAAERHQTLRRRDRVVVRAARTPRTGAVRAAERVPAQLRRRRGRGRRGAGRPGAVGRPRRRRRARRQVDAHRRRREWNDPVPDARDPPDLRP